MHLESAHCTNEIKTTSHFVHSNSNDVNKYTLALADHLRESIHASRGSGGCAVEGHHQDVYSIFQFMSYKDRNSFCVHVCDPVWILSRLTAQHKLTINGNRTYLQNASGCTSN